MNENELKEQIINSIVNSIQESKEDCEDDNENFDVNDYKHVINRGLIFHDNNFKDIVNCMMENGKDETEVQNQLFASLWEEALNRI
jgi:hypothetical protein